LIALLAVVQSIIRQVHLALPLLGGVGADALAGKLEDRGMVNKTVDGSHGRHWVFEDLVPLGEDQVGRDNDGLLLAALGEEMEEELYRLWRLLNVADVVNARPNGRRGDYTPRSRNVLEIRSGE
jgi:hypothetical protein